MDKLTLQLFDKTMRVTGANIAQRHDALNEFGHVLANGLLIGECAHYMLSVNPYLVRLLVMAKQKPGEVGGVPFLRRACDRGEVTAADITGVLHRHRQIIEADCDAVPQSYEERDNPEALASLARRVDAIAEQV